MKNLTLTSNNKNTILLWFAQMISGAGDAMYQLALLWVVLDITGSSMITGFVVMSAHLPAIIFGLYSGVLSDKFNRFPLMIFSHGAQSLTVMLIPIILHFDMNHITLIGLAAFTRNSFGTLFPPAFNAFVAENYSHNSLVKVNSLLTTSGYLAFLLGPALAGALLSVLSIKYLFIFDSITFLVAILFLFFISFPRSSANLKNTHTTVHELFSGFAYLRKNSAIGSLLFLTTINNIFIMGPALIGLPIMVKTHLNGSILDFALIEAGMALGMLFGAFSVYRFSNHVSSGKILLVGMIWDGITFAMFFFIQTVPIAFILIIFHGIGIPAITISRTAIIQRHSPSYYHGRLFSMIHLGVVGMTSLSAGLVGYLNTFISIQDIFFYFGIGGASCGILGVLIPKLRGLK